MEPYIILHSLFLLIPWSIILSLNKECKFFQKSGHCQTCRSLADLEQSVLHRKQYILSFLWLLCECFTTLIALDRMCCVPVFLMHLLCMCCTLSIAEFHKPSLFSPPSTPPCMPAPRLLHCSSLILIDVQQPTSLKCLLCPALLCTLFPSHVSIFRRLQDVSI